MTFILYIELAALDRELLGLEILRTLKETGGLKKMTSSSFKSLQGSCLHELINI